MKQHALRHEFVEFLPEHLDEGTLYISMQYATTAHKCACGCGNDVFTPLSPTQWKLLFNGRTVSLHPSIGNWSFPCQSHYWITESRIRWDRRWTKEEIEAIRAGDREREKWRHAEDDKLSIWRRLRMWRR